MPVTSAPLPGWEGIMISRARSCCQHATVQSVKHLNSPLQAARNKFGREFESYRMERGREL